MTTDNMNQPPQKTKRVVFGTEIIVDTLLYGVILGVVALVAFVLVLVIDPNGTFDAVGCNESITYPGCDVVYRARSVTFVTHCLLRLINAYNCRDLRASMFKLHVRDNWPLLYSIVVNIVLLFPLVYIPFLNTVLFKQAPIGWEWGLVAAACVIFTFMVELYKLLKRRLHSRLIHNRSDMELLVPLESRNLA